jgi:nitrous oxide reductase
MPGNDQSKDRTDHPDAAGPSHLSRRSLLGAAGVGAAGLAAGAFGGLAAAQAATARPPAAKSPHRASEPDKTAEQTSTDEHVVVHVRAGANADIDVYRGTSQTRLHDPDLAARLRRAAR